MGKRKQVHNGKQYVFWVNPALESQVEAFEIIEDCRRRNINVSELVRDGLVFAHYVRTKNSAALWDLLPEDMRRELSRETVVERVIETRVEMQPVIVEVKMPDYVPTFAPQESPTPKRAAPKIEQAEFDFEEKADSSIGDTIDQSFGNFF